MSLNMKDLDETLYKASGYRERSNVINGNDETRRVALGVRKLVHELGEEVRHPDHGRALRSSFETVRDIVSEEMAWALLCGVEPRLKVDGEGDFYTITDFRVLDDKRMDLMALFGQHPPPEGLRPLQKETLDPTIPEGRWRVFLATDDQALDLLSRLENLVVSTNAPGDFWLPLQDRRASLEGTPDAALEERVRRLTWLLRSRDAECLNLLAELFRRRTRFVWGSDEGPWADRNRPR